MQIRTGSTIEFNGKQTFTGFKKNLMDFDFINSLMSLQKLSVLMGNQIGLNLNIEFEFHSTDKVKNTILLTKDFISFFA